MPQRLSADDFNHLFRYFGRTARRLECQPTYTVAEEQEPFALFLAGTPVPFTDYPIFVAWLADIRTATSQGRQIARVRLIDEPPTDYQRWEDYVAVDNRTAGEDITYLRRSTAIDLQIPDRDDWWLFDDTHLALMKFTNDGIPLGGEIITEPDLIARHVDWWSVARSHASATLTDIAHEGLRTE